MTPERRAAEMEAVKRLAERLARVPSRRDVKRHLGYGTTRAGRVANDYQQSVGRAPAGTPLEAIGAPSIVGVTTDEPEDVEEIKRRAIYDFERRHKREMRRQTQTITFSDDPVMLVFGGDEHFGNEGTDTARVFEEAQRIADTSGAWAWRTGDVVDNFVIGRMRAIRDNSRASIPDEWALAQELVRTIEPKLIAWCGGNHDWWSAMLTGMDHLRGILPRGILYDPDEIRATVRVGGAEFRIRQRHRWAGNSQWNATHALEKAFLMDDATPDIHVGSHTHLAGLYRDAMGNRGERKGVVLTGTYKAHDDYARQRGFRVSAPGTMVALVLFPDGGWFGSADLGVAWRVFESVR